MSAIVNSEGQPVTRHYLLIRESVHAPVPKVLGSYDYRADAIAAQAQLGGCLLELDFWQEKVKMKMADPAQVTALMTKAVRECVWSDDTLREHAYALVDDITSALAHAGCVVIQPDIGAPGTAMSWPAK